MPVWHSKMTILIPFHSKHHRRGSSNCPAPLQPCSCWGRAAWFPANVKDLQCTLFWQYNTAHAFAVNVRWDDIAWPNDFAGNRLKRRPFPSINSNESHWRYSILVPILLRILTHISEWVLHVVNVIYVRTHTHITFSGMPFLQKCVLKLLTWVLIRQCYHFRILVFSS